jgi:hypothetical protein
MKFPIVLLEPWGVYHSAALSRATRIHLMIGERAKGRWQDGWPRRYLVTESS